MPRIATAIRERANLSKSEIARLLGVAASAVSQFEDLKTQTNEATLRAYAAAIGQPFEITIVQALARLEVLKPRGTPAAKKSA